MRNPPESSIAPPDAIAPAPSRMSDAFVVCAMTLVAVALGTGLHLQLAMSVMHAAAAAGSIWFGLFVLHLVMGRVQRGTPDVPRAPVQKPRPDLGRLSASPVVQRSRRPELASEPPPLPMTAARQTAHDGASERTSRQDGATSEQLASPLTRPSLDEAGPVPSAIGWDVRPGKARDTLATTPKPAVFPPLEQTVAAALKANALGGRTAGGEHDASAAGARRAQRAPTGGLDGKPPPVPSRVPASDTQTAEASAAKSSEIESMQTVIEQLARQLNTPVESGGAADQSASTTAASEEEDAEQALARSIEALKAASGAMRDVVATPRPAAGAKRQAAGNPAASVDPTTSRIAAAIAANQYEVYLDSIAGLADHKTRHFEITLRVKIDGGPAPDAEDCAALLGSGAGTRLDAAKLVRVAQIASRLSSRGATAALFARLMPESLVDDMVLETCAEIVGRDAGIGRQLVLSFRQSAVRAFTKDHWETLATLAENGLRFAVEELSDLAMDFDVLKERGFHFVKVDAAALLAGMQAHDGIISPEEACRRFTGTGLSVIVGGVLDDATVAWALGLGAPYGQGALFSAPRPVKDLGAPQEAAA
jgi:cyclic-di-GMP phosphodiesterase TipF (flagellum assembly factor)